MAMGSAIGEGGSARPDGRGEAAALGSGIPSCRIWLHGSSFGSSFYSSVCSSFCTSEHSGVAVVRRAASGGR
jgi:hypothetical protein